MKAEKLPSGNWRVRVTVGKKDGKPVRRSITAKTRQEAMRMAALYEGPDTALEMSLAEACREYLDTRGKELSPSTVRGYLGTLRTCVDADPIGSVKIAKIKSPQLQAWISRIHGKAKTKRNHLGFVVTVLKYYIEGASYRVRIADEMQEELHVPTMDEVNRVLSICDEETRRAALLGIFGMRRGEICALAAEDLDRKNCLIRISKSVAKTDAGEWILKTPKTRSSVRWIEVTPAVMDMLPEDGPVVSVSPDQITNRFARAVRKAGVEHFRFHDLRAFFASVSVSSVVNASERTVQDLGGWATNNVLKRHYERSISDVKQKETARILSFFEKNLAVRG